jgi:hypothetical protein
MKYILTFSLLACLFCIPFHSIAQAFTFTSGQLSYTENFDGMGPDGTSFLSGWNSVRYAGTGTIGAVLPLTAGDGSSNSGGIYNLGTTGATDRAFGSLASGSTVPCFGASFLNSTGSGITQISLAGVMEQWRSGSSNTANEVWAFEYSLDATDLSTGNWTAVSSFDLLEKIISSSTAGALDGNLPENQTTLAAVISGLNWTPNATLWIRWSDANDSGSDGVCSIDNLSVTVTTGTVTADPEPTNYPTAFAATAAGNSVSTSWTDATGAQLPAAYLIRISTGSGIQAPVDGTFVADDLDLSDGNGAKNVPFGTQNYIFANLAEGTTYNFRIYPYTNGGTLVDYKTDGTPPSGSATTQTIAFHSTFDTDLAPWTQFSVSGTQIWTSDLTHGVNGSGCAKMSGFETGQSFVNEDWLISPSINLSNMTNTQLQFFSAYNYAGNPLSVLISSDYTSGDPTLSGTWNDLSSSAVFSPGGWAWTASGYINAGIMNQSNVHLAFRYTSSATEARTWEIDEVSVAGNLQEGIRESKEKQTLVSVYPNPASNQVMLDMPENGRYSVLISTPGGQTVRTYSGEFTTLKMDVQDLKPGLYFLTMRNSSGSLNETQKLLIR